MRKLLLLAAATVLPAAAETPLPQACTLLTTDDILDLTCKEPGAAVEVIPDFEDHTQSRCMWQCDSEFAEPVTVILYREKHFTERGQTAAGDFKQTLAAKQKAGGSVRRLRGLGDRAMIEEAAESVRPVSMVVGREQVVVFSVYKSAEEVIALARRVAERMDAP